MTVPAPRGPEAGTAGDATVLGILVETTRRIEDGVSTGFREVRGDMAEFRRETVTRREFDQRLGAVSDDVDEIKRQREAEQVARQDREDQVKRDRRIEWRWRLGLLGGAVTAFGAALIGHTGH